MHRRTLCENVDSAKIKVPFYRYRYFTRGIVSIYASILMNRYSPTNIPVYLHLLQQSYSLCSYHEDALPCHPANRQHSSSLYPVVIASIEVPAHAKISYLYLALSAVVLPLTPLSTHQAVPRGQVSVHKVQRRQELHS